MRFEAVRLPALALALLGVACGTAVFDFDDPNSIGVGEPTSGIDPAADTDGDGIPDVDEGSGDANGDGTPAHLDPADQQLGGVTDPTRDSDEDGTPDLTEGVADTNGNGVPAYLDPAEGGTTSPGPDGGTGSGNQVAFGATCTAADTCASVGGATGCCEPSTLTCGALSGGTCQTGVVCGGASFCGGASACCASDGSCGTLAADTVTCESGGGGGGGGTTDAGTGGGAPFVDSCPDTDEGEPGCCAASGRCGVMNAIFGCLEPDNPVITTAPPDLTCNP